MVFARKNCFGLLWLLRSEPFLKKIPVSLDYAKISNDRCSTLTGITKNQFLQVWSHIKDFEYPCKMSSINGLGFYLTRLRTGLSIQKLAKLIPIASYFQVNFLFIINCL